MSLDPTDASEIIRLWPDGPPTRIDVRGDEVSYAAPPGVAAGTTFLRNISDPTLTVFAPRRDGKRRRCHRCPGRRLDDQCVDARGPRRRPMAGRSRLYRLSPQVPSHGFITGSGGVRIGDGGRRPFARGTTARPDAPRSMHDLISSEQYLRGACGGRRRWTPRHRARSRRRVLVLVASRCDRHDRFLSWCVPCSRCGVGAERCAARIRRGDLWGRTRGLPVPVDAPPLFTVVAQDDRLLFKIVEGLHAGLVRCRPAVRAARLRRGRHGFGMVKQGLPVDRWPDLFLDWLGDIGMPGQYTGADSAHHRVS